MRTLLASAVVVLMFVGCSDDTGASYAGISELAADLDAGGVDCSDPVVADEPEVPEGSDTATQAATLPSESGTCGSGDSSLQIFVFEDEEARDKWLTLGAKFSNNVVTGPNWTVIAPDENTAEDVVDALGGET